MAVARIGKDGCTVSHGERFIQITRVRTPRYRGRVTGLTVGTGHYVDDPESKCLVILGINTGFYGNGELGVDIGGNAHYNGTVDALTREISGRLGRRGYETVFCSHDTLVSTPTNGKQINLL